MLLLPNAAWQLLKKALLYRGHRQHCSLCQTVSPTISNTVPNPAKRISNIFIEGVIDCQTLYYDLPFTVSANWVL